MLDNEKRPLAHWSDFLTPKPLRKLLGPANQEDTLEVYRCGNCRWFFVISLPESRDDQKERGRMAARAFRHHKCSSYAKR